jgi:metallo-beta-lactamase family protein
MVEPIYTAEDARACLTQFRPVAYQEWVPIGGGVRARFWNAGHLLGSASVEVETAGAAAEAQPMRILFSGDVGPDAKLLHRDPEAPAGFDYVICESTYGDTDRRETSSPHRRRLLRNEVRAAARPSGALLIPSFAVERTQELLVDLVALMDSGDIPKTPIIIDSPLATRASAIFERHAAEMEEGAALVRALRSHHVRFTESVDQSKALDRLLDFHIVIAASGMCEAGRIRHRLRNWLWREEATVLMVGYQAEGTLGRILLDGASAVRIQGDEIKVRARVRSLDLYSGHADGPELAAWVKERLPIRNDIFLVHGEEPARAGLRDRLSAFMPAARVLAPKLDDVVALTPSGARAAAPEHAPRIEPEQVGKLDWHNDLSKLLLDINDAVEGAADERGRAIVVRRLRRALEEARS